MYYYNVVSRTSLYVCPVKVGHIHQMSQGVHIGGASIKSDSFEIWPIGIASHGLSSNVDGL